MIEALGLQSNTVSLWKDDLTDEDIEAADMVALNFDHTAVAHAA